MPLIFCTFCKYTEVARKKIPMGIDGSELDHWNSKKFFKCTYLHSITFIFLFDISFFIIFNKLHRIFEVNETN